MVVKNEGPGDPMVRGVNLEPEEPASNDSAVYVGLPGLEAQEANDIDQATRSAEIVKPETGNVSTKKERRFQIKKWNAVAMWSWAICTDTCAICRNNLYEASIDYQANPNGDPEHPGLSIAWGQCGHVFHLDCIQRWLKTRSACPLCQKEWDFTKIEKINPSSN